MFFLPPVGIAILYYTPFDIFVNAHNLHYMIMSQLTPAYSWLYLQVKKNKKLKIYSASLFDGRASRSSTQ
ncbi:TPA: hypothetical protein DF272_00310 [Candidatus Falkowbacteria bacterium]|nr:hypothetical protein [Candidatus Falkowbacteria bacterium]